MEPINRILSLGRSRLFLQAWLNRLGVLLLVAAGLAVVAVMMHRLLAVEVPTWVYPLLVVAAMAAAPLWAMWRQPGRQQVAMLLDERLKLKDHLATALYVQQRQADQPFASQVMSQAQKLATTASVSQAVRLRLAPVWGWFVIVTLMATLMAWLLPSMDLLGRRARELEQAQQLALADQAQQRIERAVNVIVQPPPGISPGAKQDQPLPPEVTQAFEELSQMTREDLSTPQGRQDAAAKLLSVEEKLAQQEQEARRGLDPVSNAMSRLSTSESGPADAFTRAMRRGDFEQAESEIRRLGEQVEQMSPQDREQFARQMDELAQQLEQMAQDPQQQRDQPQDAAATQPADAGGKTQEPPSPSQDNKPSDVSKSLADALKRMSQGAQQQNQPSQQQSQQQQAQQNPSQNQQGQQSQQGQQQSAQGQQSQQGQQQSAQGQQSQQGQQQSAQGQQSQQGQQQSAQGQQSQQGQQQSAQGQQSQQGQQCQQAGEDAGNQLSRLNQQQKQIQRLSQGRQQAQQAAEQMANQSSSQQPGQDGQQSQPGQQGQSGSGQSAGQSGGGGEEQGSQQSADGRGEGGGPAGGQGVGNTPGGPMLGPSRQPAGGFEAQREVAPNDPRGKVLSTWVKDDQNNPGQASREFDQAVGQAASQAEQALSQDQVPARYRQNIQEYFDQISQPRQE